jgi:hypothetical protein
MVRRLIGLVMIIMTSVLALGGCQGLRQAIRSVSDDQERAMKKEKGTNATSEPSSVESDTTKISAVDSDPKNPQPFFKNNRRPGTWSSEAREIESHLGVQ